VLKNRVWESRITPTLEPLEDCAPRALVVMESSPAQARAEFFLLLEKLEPKNQQA
jgi:hypothetical protein